MQIYSHSYSTSKKMCTTQPKIIKYALESKCVLVRPTRSISVFVGHIYGPISEDAYLTVHVCGFYFLLLKCNLCNAIWVSTILWFTP